MVLYCKTRCLESCNDHCSKDIGYKIGDTFLYKKENCYMIFMYMKGDPCADTILFCISKMSLQSRVLYMYCNTSHEMEVK